MCLLRCSPLLNNFSHPGTVHLYLRPSATPAPEPASASDRAAAAAAARLKRPLPLTADTAEEDSERDDGPSEPTVGTRRPRLFFVRLGMGTGTGRILLCLDRRRPVEDVGPSMVDDAVEPGLARYSRLEMSSRE